MRHDPITSQRGHGLVLKLQARGWRVIARRRANLERWADEIWELESDWAFRGIRAYLTFLVDPMDLTIVWALGASASMPSSSTEAGSTALIPVRHQWEKGLESFLADLEHISEPESWVETEKVVRT